MSALSDTWRRTRVCAAFIAAASVVTLASWLMPPGFVPAVALSGVHVLGSGAVWQLATYPFVHASLFHLAVVATVLVTLGGITEPLLGFKRSLLLLIAGAVLPGVAYIAVEPKAAFIGAAFVATAFAAAFLVLWVRDRRTLPRWYAALAALVAGHAALVLLGPTSLLVPHLVSWVVGGFVASPVAARSAA